MERNGRRIATRSRALVAKDVGNEVVLYDLETDKVHLLDPRASVIWRLAKEPIALDDLVTEATTHLAADEPWREEVLAIIDELASHGLLDEAGAPSLLDRRRVLKLAGAAALAAPAITTILAPPAAASHSDGAPTALGQICPGGTGTHCSGGVCGTDGRCGSCISNTTTTCAGGDTSNVSNRCCTGNACTNTGATAGLRCCQPTGGSAGTGTCCATNSAGTCVCTPLNSNPTVADPALCCAATASTTTLKNGTTCCAGAGQTCVAKADCCNGAANCGGNPKTCSA